MATPEEQVEKIIGGKWKFLRDECTKESLKSMGYPDEAVSFIVGTKPRMNVVRNGDSFNMEFEMVPGKVMKYAFKLGEDVDVKDDNVPPVYHNKEMIVWDNGVVKLITKSQLSGPLKIDTETHMVRVGDFLYNLTSKLGDRTVVGNRVMVRDN